MKKLKVGRRVVIGNSAVNDQNTLKRALDFSKKTKRNEYKFLDVALNVYPMAIVISWAVEGVGFGEVTYHLSGTKLKLDSEGMSKEFVNQLQAEVLKRQKKKTLKLTVSDNILHNFFDRINQVKLD